MNSDDEHTLTYTEYYQLIYSLINLNLNLCHALVTICQITPLMKAGETFWVILMIYQILVTLIRDNIRNTILHTETKVNDMYGCSENSVIVK